MRTILVPLDLSPASRQVLQAAVGFARAEGASLHLQHVLPEPGSLGLEANGDTENRALEVICGKARSQLQQLADVIPPNTVQSCEVSTGAAWKEICRAASGLDAARIVMGAHAYNAVERLVGTTVERVVKHAPCPVVVIRGPARLWGAG